MIDFRMVGPISAGRFHVLIGLRGRSSEISLMSPFRFFSLPPMIDADDDIFFLHCQIFSFFISGPLSSRLRCFLVFFFDAGIFSSFFYASFPLSMGDTITPVSCRR